jgi:hypothetical protein
MTPHVEYQTLSEAAIAFRRTANHAPGHVIVLLLRRSRDLYTIIDCTDEPDPDLTIDNVDVFIILTANSNMCEEIVNGLIIGNDNGH